MIFVAWALIFSQFPFAWIADIVAVGILFFIYFHLLENRVIGIRCPHCSKYIATNTPWVCGFCQKENRSVDLFPFVHRCEHCGAEPKAYRCHHRICGKVIFLTNDELEDNHATCRNSLPSAPSSDPTADRKEAKEALSHEIEMADLASKLDHIKQRTALGKKKTPNEEIEESFIKHHARVMGSQEFARRQRAVFAEQFKDDPEMLKCANDSLEQWLHERV